MSVVKLSEFLSESYTGYTGSAGDNTLLNVANDVSSSTLYPSMVASVGADETVKVSTTKLYFNASTGTLSATELNSLSDINLKENVKKVENALNIIKNIEGIQFLWKDTLRKSYGVSAQQVEELIPELINNNEYKSVNYSGLLAFVIEALKEINKKVEYLENGSKIN